jgi:hypothetical protein
MCPNHRRVLLRSVALPQNMGRSMQVAGITVRSTSQMALTTGVKFCVYGRSSAGKTKLISTALQWSPFVVSAEKGTLSLKKFNVPAIEITTFTQFEDVCKWAWSSAEARQFGLICVDSATDIADTLLADNLKKQKDGRKAYGDTNQEILRMLRNYRDLPNHHVYFSAWQEWDTDQGTGRTSFRPSMPGKTLTAAFPYLFDEIFQLHVWNDANNVPQRGLRCHPDFQYDAKDRSGMLDMWEQPDLNQVLTKILAA